MQLSDFTNVEDRAKSALRRLLPQWKPFMEARAIELLNEGLPRSDISRTLVEEFKLDVTPTKRGSWISTEGAAREYRGLNAIYQQLLTDKKLDSSIKEINKILTGKYLTNAQRVVQDKQILDHYLENKSIFKGKPANQLAKSFNAKYNLLSGTNVAKNYKAISRNAIHRAFNAAIAGKYPDYDEYFKARALDDFIVTRHANIFPDVKKLDDVIKKIVQSGNNFIVDDSILLQDRMKMLRKEYAKAIGMDSTNPHLENNFTARIRKIMNSYGGNPERYEAKLYGTIKAPQLPGANIGYIDSILHRNLMAIASTAGKMSNLDVARALGLPKADVELLTRLSPGMTQIGRTYKLPAVMKGGKKVYMAGDHTDIKALTKNFPKYKQEFMRIAFIQDALNTVKAGYDKKILALKNLGEQGHTFDKGSRSSMMTHRPIERGGYYRVPFSGPLTAAEDAAGGRTIPAAIKKLQQEFAELTGGYKLGGFNIKDGKVVPQTEFFQPRINETTSPLSMTLRETLKNLKYGTKEMKTIPNEFLNVVDRAIVGPEGATTAGRINILKQFGPQDLKTSGYMQAMRVSGLKGTSAKVTEIMKKGVSEAIRAATINEGDLCRIFGMKRGGLAGGGCGPQMRQALQEAPEETMTKIAEVGSSKLKNAARGFLGALGRFGPKVGKYGAVVAAGALAQPLVRQFMNDDPSTYLTDPDQMEGMLLSTIEAQERPKPRNEILDFAHTGAAVGATAAAIPGTVDLYKYRRGLLESKIPKAGPVTEAGLTAGDYLKRHGKGYGKLRAGAGTGMKFFSGMFTPAGLLATEPLRIAQMRSEGESWGEVAKSPSLWMGPAFAPGMTSIATAGMNKGSMLAKALRLGMSPAAMKVMGKAGVYGLLASLGLSGYDKYKDYKNKRGWFAKD